MKIEKSPQEIADFLTDYWSTYMAQHGAGKYSKETLFNDMLYGVGAAMGDHYRFANGYDQFKKDLLEHLGVGL